MFREVIDLVKVIQRDTPRVIGVRGQRWPQTRQFALCLARSLQPGSIAESTVAVRILSASRSVRLNPGGITLLEFRPAESFDGTTLRKVAEQLRELPAAAGLWLLVGQVPESLYALADGEIILEEQPRSDSLGLLRYVSGKDPRSRTTAFLYVCQDAALKSFPQLDQYSFEQRLPGRVKTALGCPLVGRALGFSLPDNCIIGVLGDFSNDKNALALGFLREGLESGSTCAYLSGVKGTSLQELKSLRKAGLSEQAELIVVPKSSTVPEEFLYDLAQLLKAHKNLERLHIADLDLFYFSSDFITEYLFPLLRSLPVLTLYTLCDTTGLARIAAASDLLIRLESARQDCQMHHYLSILKSPVSRCEGRVWRYEVQRGRILEWSGDNLTGGQAPAASTGKPFIEILPEMFYFDANEKRVLEELVEAYNERHGEPTVRLPSQEITNLQQYQEEVAPLEIHGEVAYDLLPMDTCLLPELAEKDVIHCLDEYVPADFPKRFVSAAYDSCKVRGRLYALPHLVNTGILAYRRDLLERYGCPLPRTWDQLVKVCRHILKREKDSSLWGFGFQGAAYEGLSCNFLELFWHNGGEVFNSRGDFQLHENNREALETVNFLTDCIHHDRISPPDTVNMMEYEGEKMFLEGHLVFLRTWPRILSKAQRLDVDGEKIAFTKLPQGPSGSSHIGIIGASCYVVPKSVPRPESVVNFYLDFFDETTIEKIAVHAWSCSPFLSAYQSPTVVQHRPYYTKMLDMFATGRQRNDIPRYPNLSANLFREVNLALRQEQTPEEALQTIHQKFTMLLSEFGGNPLIQKALSYIGENFHEQIDRNTVAQYVGLSQSYFSALFKEHTGFNFSEYLLMKRIETAKSLLAKTSRKVTEIASSCGFPDMSYFSQVFRRVVNMSPSRYRSSIHKSGF